MLKRSGGSTNQGERRPAFFAFYALAEMALYGVKQRKTERPRKTGKQRKTERPRKTRERDPQ